mmetsp:Transcript_11018/g.45735  ORF Transcript_11018/g.45735 Transcript_11018/m.45735 type:complete len:204 (+) Transcript_11018:1100-1711(+)
MRLRCRCVRLSAAPRRREPGKSAPRRRARKPRGSRSREEASSSIAITSTDSRRRASRRVVQTTSLATPRVGSMSLLARVHLRARSNRAIRAVAALRARNTCGLRGMGRPRASALALARVRLAPYTRVCRETSLIGRRRRSPRQAAFSRREVSSFVRSASACAWRSWSNRCATAPRRPARGRSLWAWMMPMHLTLRTPVPCCSS